MNQTDRTEVETNDKDDDRPSPERRTPEDKPKPPTDGEAIAEIGDSVGGPA